MFRVKQWRETNQLNIGAEGCVVTIGVFDGVHRGHQSLVTAARTAADKLGVPLVLLTFDPHPLAVIRPDHVPPLLGTIAQRAATVAALGVDHMVAVRFDSTLAGESPEEFFTVHLEHDLRARAVFVGENFTFGHRAEGTTDTLRSLGAAHGIDVTVVPLVQEHGVVVSSTSIRTALGAGDVTAAAEKLGRPFAVTETVQRGAGRGGKQLGYPTANLYVPEYLATPADGVYAGWFTIEDEDPVAGSMQPHRAYPTAVSVGNNPTFGDQRRSVEAFVLDQDADLYGRTCRVEFTHHLRPMVKFDGLDDLLAQMAQDVNHTRQYLQQDAQPAYLHPRAERSA